MSVLTVLRLQTCEQVRFFSCIAFLLFASLAEAMTWTEDGDAGELLNTGNVTTGLGELSTIEGTLIILGGGFDDVDLYKIRVVDTDAFSVSVSANLSADNDATMWLFDSNGFLVGGNNFPNIFPGYDDRESIDCSSPGSPCLPEFFPGNFAGATTGTYYLAFSLFATSPSSATLALSSWNRNPAPLQTGPYTLALSGVEFAAVPIPSALFLLGSVFGFLGFLKGVPTELISRLVKRPGTL